MDSPSSEWLPPSGPIDNEFGQAGGDKPTGNQWKTSCLVGGIPTPLKNMDVNWDLKFSMYGQKLHTTIQL